MSTPLNDRMENALVDLRAQQEAIQQLGDRMKGAAASATSVDRLVTATVDSQGRLTDLKLDGARYRRMAPKELTQRILETVRSAQEMAHKEAMAMFADLVPANLKPLLSGDLDLGEMFDAAAEDVVRPLFPEETPSTEPGRSDA